MSAPLEAVAMRQIGEALSRASGLDLRTLQENRLQWIVESRCRALDLISTADYAEYLLSSPDEVQELIDATVVPETRFFRDAAVFTHLRKWVPQMAEEFPGTLNILSAPCSTGQEAYSVAATLHAGGLPLHRFTLTAVDLSAAALRVAERGIYPESAVHRLTTEQLQSLGHAEGDHWKMHASLKARIHFRQMNLAEPAALADGPYHLILCRNLFIYLHPDARRTLADSLAAALAPGGRLILGSADHVDDLHKRFAPVRPAASFAFTLRSHPAQHKAVSPKVAATLLAHKPQHRHHEPAPAKPHVSASADLEATTLYRSALQHQQAGDTRRAEHRCRQALYLDPGYLPALELLESLWGNVQSGAHTERLRRALAARIGRTRAAMVEEAR